ncbi:hypothetical protein BC938DRAFT_483996 [Jimgerdemannia flammicorona]|uniref:Uncharacterized protein n=1 Tax=Jimgerdemannia flammicorona TaxID=994334 RepID=A0A433QAY3_9FUNG|nr:hypothetical protein BC938DRAFT_483996 [Jimgerdemannia flammicorona]
MQAMWIGHDAAVFPPPGTMYSVQITSNLSSPATARLYMICKGTLSSGQSTFIFEAGGGAFSASFFGVQDLLIAAGRRVCLYDRPSYGWSEYGPIPRQATSRLKRFITCSKLRTRRDSAGSELVQTRTCIPTIAILDGYPSGSQYLDNTDTIPLQAQAADYARVAIWYKPTELATEMTAKYGGNNEWHVLSPQPLAIAQWADWTGTYRDSQLHPPTELEIGWPSLANPQTPVVISPANTTVTDTNDQPTVYMRFAQLYV